MAPSAPAQRQYLTELLQRYAPIEARLRQAFLIELHSRGVVTIDEITRQARKRAQRETVEFDVPDDDNVQVAHRWDAEEKKHIQAITLEYVADRLDRDAIDDIVNLTRKRERAETLEDIASSSTVTFAELAESVQAFCRLPEGQTVLPTSESKSVRLALIRRFISEQLQFQSVAKNYLRIRDFDDVVDRILGDDRGAGLIGGKAAGMLLGAKILEVERGSDPAAPDIPLRIPESFFLRSDTMEAFLRHNGLRHLQDHKYKDIDEVRNEYPLLRDLFKNATFPPVIVERLTGLLERVGTHPLIVRSSSLLEDRFGATFAGKYRSVFVSNQGTPEERLAELLGAIAEVYASSLHPDPISYRRRHGLLDYDENMAVLIQKIVGAQAGRYYLPAWAGVAFSRNLFRRNPRIRPEDGMARVVFGLGTRAVDRIGDDKPRILPLGLPALRPEVQAKDVIEAAQKHVDVVDLQSNRFHAVPVAELLDSGARVPGMGLVFSTVQHGFLRPLMGDGLLTDPSEMVVTFDSFASSSPYPAFLKWCLQTLERVYGCPVDIEFAFDGHEFYLLQCRPQAIHKVDQTAHIPSDIPDACKVFSANRDILPGSVHDIDTIVLIDPRDYNALPGDDRRLTVGKVVRKLNRLLADQRFILVGPGRWGSRDLRMGVRVSYSDIDNTQMLIEVAREQGGYTPEVSFGSHFFQDLVESDIHYLALYPDEDGVTYDEELLLRSPNALAELVPEAADLADVVRVIRVPELTGGRLLRVDMDGGEQRALGYLSGT